MKGSGMREDAGVLVHEVIGRGLDLKRRLVRGEDVALAVEQAEFLRLLARMEEIGSTSASSYSSMSMPTLSRSGGGGTDREEFHGDEAIRYVLASWLDELFVIDSPWSDLWNEQKLEAELFGTNDRAWKFWTHARRALLQSETELLEICFICVMMGFRGAYRGQPEKLRSWVQAARGQVEQARAWQPPPEIEPPTFVPPLYGQAQFQSMLLRVGILVLCLIPVLTFFLVQLGR